MAQIPAGKDRGKSPPAPDNMARRVRGPSEPRSNKGVLIVSTLLSVVVAVVSGWVAWRMFHDEVYFDNGLDQAVVFEVDGKAFPQGAGAPTKRSLSTGSHTVVVRAIDASEIERSEVTIDSKSLVETFLDSRFFVYNPGGVRIYVRETIGYGSKEKYQTYAMELIGNERFFVQNGVDDVFRDPPVELRAKSAREVRVVFNLVDEMDYNRLGMIRLEDGDRLKAEEAFRKAIELAPCAQLARTNLIAVLGSGETSEKSEAEAKEWVKVCPESVEAHRVYQETVRIRTGTESLLAEYQLLAEQHPGSGMHQYLYARLIAEPDLASVELQKALDLDPSQGWPHAALALVSLSAENYEEAFAAIKRALASDQPSDHWTFVCAMAGIGAGRTKEALDLIAPFTTHERETFTSREARRILLLASGQYAAVAELLEKESRLGYPPAVLSRHEIDLAMARGNRDQVRRVIEVALRRSAGSPTARVAAFEYALTTADFPTAAKLFEEGLQLEQVEQWIYGVYAAAAMELTTPRRDSAALLAKLESQIEADPRPAERKRFALALVRFQRRKISQTELVDTARLDPPPMLEHAYFFIAARAMASGDRRTAREWFGRAQRASVDWAFPRSAARHLEAHLSGVSW